MYHRGCCDWQSHGRAVRLSCVSHIHMLLPKRCCSIIALVLTLSFASWLRCNGRLEILQSQVELRIGGETGVASVRCLAGHDAVWSWLDSAVGSWAVPLVEAAMKTLEPGGRHARTDGIIERSEVDVPHLFLIQFVDGLRGAVLLLGDGYISKMAYADNRRDPNALEEQPKTTAVQYHVTNADNTSTAAFGCPLRATRHLAVSSYSLALSDRPICLEIDNPYRTST